MSQTIAYAATITAIICFVLVMMELYARRQTTLMIVCIVLAFVGGIGLLVGLVYGWMKVKPWRLQNIMYVYTAAVIVMLLFGRSLIPAWLMP